MLVRPLPRTWPVRTPTLAFATGQCPPHCWRRSLFVSHAAWQAASKKVVTPSSSTPKPPSAADTLDALGIDTKDPKKDDVLPPLSRPLGVRERPTTKVKTATERMKELMDTDVRMAQRRHLVKEASKGYFHDLNMTRRHGGKTWIAPKVLIKEDKALYLPNIKGKSLDKGVTKDTTTTCYGRVTVLAMLSTKISEVHTKGFVEPTHNRYRDHPLYQFVQVNLQENLLKSMLVNLFSSNLRSSVPRELQSKYLVSSQNLEYVREALGMTNSRVGYVYLIDQNLRIRWGACADATLEETQALEACTGVLLKRLEKLPDMRQGLDNVVAGDS